ncbi:MAG: hypothetical protein ACYTFV_03730 [Planctomycetota bacterium]
MSRAYVIVDEGLLPRRVVWEQPTAAGEAFYMVPCTPPPLPEGLPEAQRRILALEDEVRGLHDKLKKEHDLRLQGDAKVAKLRRRNRILRNEED